MKKCPNCKLKVENDIKTCPNCQYDFAHRSFKNIPADKLNKRSKFIYYLVAAIIIGVALIPDLYVWYRRLDRVTQRQEQWDDTMTQIYGSIESGDYTFEEVEALVYNDAKVFKPYYDQFINDVKNYHPSGHETNLYVFHQNRLLGISMSATIEYDNYEFGVLYHCDHTGIDKREYSFTHELNLKGDVDVDQVTAFCKYTKLHKTEVIQKIRDFMGNVGKQSFYEETIPMGEGNLFICYKGGGYFSVIYCLN